MKNAAFWIDYLDLEKHPEGGYFKEFYRSDELINRKHLPQRYRGDRCFSTSIYFMLESGDFSSFHRIKSDEIWHFYEGSSLLTYYIDFSGKLHEAVLGNKPELGESLQLLFPRDSWIAARCKHDSSYGLIGCTVAPGFDFNDFYLGERDELLEMFPQHSALIRDLSRP